MFDTGLIDSLRIRVKMSRVKVLDPRLITDFVEYYPSLELVDEEVKKARPVTRIINGITYRMYVKAFIDSQKIAHEYCVFQISAKMLKSRYFEGLTKDNIKLVIDDINALNIIQISHEDFLQGLVSDIDICINQLIDIDSYKGALVFMKQFPKDSVKPLLHYINKDKNLGLDFNKREKATNSKPYCKIYHKGFELQTKSKEFYDTFLKPMKEAVLNNLVRYEFTIKAHKHKEYLIKKGLNADFKTLEDLLNTSGEDLKNIAKTGLKCYIEETKIKRAPADLSPSDLRLWYFIENLIELGFDTEKLLGFTHQIECPVSRSRLKTHTKKLIDSFTSVDKNAKRKLEQNDKVKDFLSGFGLNMV